MERKNDTRKQKPHLSRNQAGQAPKSGVYEKYPFSLYQIREEMGKKKMEEMLYTVKEVAEILKTNASYVYALKRAGKLKFMKIGSLKCRKVTLEAFLEKYDGMDLSDPENITQLIQEDIEETGKERLA